MRKSTRNNTLLLTQGTETVAVWTETSMVKSNWTRFLVTWVFMEQI